MEEQLVKYFSDNLSLEERRKIEEWRSTSDQNASEFLSSHQAWKMSKDQEVDAASALSAVMSKIDDIENDKKSKSAVDSGFKVYLKYAAIAILGIGLAFYGQNFLTQTSDQLAIASADNLEIVALPDGSIVTLSANSTLTYDKNFNGSTRNVALEGKAFFDIKRDENKPFVVTTAQSKIEVLGTSFLVNTIGANASTEVVVKTGRVAVSKKETEVPKTIELIAGEVGRLTLDAVVFEKSSIENYNYLAWKTKLIEFNGESLRTVLNVLSEVYGVQILVSDENIYNCEMSAKFDNQPMDSVLEIVSRTFNLELTKSGNNEFYLSGGGCILVD